MKTQSKDKEWCKSLYLDVQNANALLVLESQLIINQAEKYE